MIKEIEVTAELSESQYKTLKTYLDKNLTRTRDQNRFMIRFFKGRVNVREPIDYRYKWNNGAQTIVVKKGALGNQSRQEVTIELGKDNELPNIIRMTSFLGYDTGIALYRDLIKYENSRLEVTLGIAKPFFFVEVESLHSQNTKEALSHISDLFKEIGLQPLAKNAYQSFIRKVDREANAHFKLKDFPESIFTHPNWENINTPEIKELLSG